MKSNRNFSLPRRLLLPSAALYLAGAAPLSAATYSDSWNSGFANGGTVPDGNPTGWSDSRALAIPAGELITDVNVTISMGGGWNGDLYAYLSHPNGPGVAVLLNRPGKTGASAFGFGDNILTITLDDGAANGDSHFYQSATAYQTAITNNSAFQPDGRTASPLTVNGSEPRPALLSRFNGMDASSGNWTLFVTDVVSGDQTIVTSWGLSITTVPEPQTILLALLSAAAILGGRRPFARDQRQAPQHSRGRRAGP